MTYHGWPLYSWVGDTAAGKATGQALDANGGYWYVLSPAGKVIRTSATPTAKKASGKATVSPKGRRRSPRPPRSATTTPTIHRADPTSRRLPMTSG